MDRANYWQMMICMWLLCTLKLSAADTQQPEGISDPLKALTCRATVDRHASISRRKQKLCAQAQTTELKRYTDRLDHLLKFSVSIATAGPLDIFKRLVRVIEDDTADCVVCDAVAQSSRKLADEFKWVASISVCSSCYDEKLYSSFAQDEQVELCTEKDAACNACSFWDQIYEDLFEGEQWLVKRAIMQLKSNEQVSVCTRCDSLKLMNNEIFCHEIHRAMPDCVEYMLNKIALFKDEPIVLKAASLTTKERVHIIYLLKQYRRHLDDIAKPLSDGQQLKVLKDIMRVSSNRGKAFAAFTKRRPLIEQARALLLHEHARIQNILNDIESQAK